MNDSKAATRERLQQLWADVADSLIAYFRETSRDQLTAAMLEVATGFLKQNGFTLDQMSDPTGAQARLSQLAALSLPFSTTVSASPCLSVAPARDGESAAPEESN